MKRSVVVLAVVSALVTGAAGLDRAVTARRGAPPASAAFVAGDGDATAKEAVVARLGRMPVTFVGNEGRWDPRVSWVASGPDATAYFVGGGVRWALPGPGGETGWVLDQSLLGARQAVPTASRHGEAVVSYLLADAHPSLPTAAELTVDDAWPGIDVVWSGTGGRIEATYLLEPGADPSRVRVSWHGSDALSVTGDGRLSVSTPTRRFEEEAPKAFQQVDGRRVPVEVAFELDGQDGYGFRVGAYDPAQGLVIDPVTLLYAGFLGGAWESGFLSNADFGSGIAVDGGGNAYITGSTDSRADTFPETVGAYQPTYAGGFRDAFVAKINAGGSGLVYATFLGGEDFDDGRAIAVDAAGHAYVTGHTSSLNFPVTPGAFQPELGGSNDAFVVKLNLSGTALMYSSFLGGEGSDIGRDVAVDTAGSAYITGESHSGAGFPSTPGVFQPANAGGLDGFVAKVNPSGSALVYAGFLGGAAGDVPAGIAVDGAGSAYIMGSTDSTEATFPITPGVFQPANAGGILDGFVVKVNPSGSALVYASFLGGSDNEDGGGVAVDTAGNAYVVGSTWSLAATFPETAGAFQPEHGGGVSDAFVAKVNVDGSALVYATYLGGAGSDEGFGIALDASGHAYITGETSSTSATFPVTPGAFQAEMAGQYDVFVARVGPTGSAMRYVTYLGGGGGDNGRDIAVDTAGNAYVTGGSFSTAATFPSSWAVQAENAGGRDAFVAKIATTSAPPADFDGNGTTDIAVFRPSTGVWHVRNGAGAAWGLSTDMPVACDFDGNGTADVAVFRPVVGGWYVNGQSPVFHGLSGDVPVPGDYDGDGRCDMAVFRPSVGAWYVKDQPTVFLGLTGDIPVPADYDQNGTTDVAIFRPAVGGWYRNGAVTTFHGLTGDIPLPGDYDGNGMTDVAVFRPAVGGWYVHGQGVGFLGLGSDIPVPGQYVSGPATDRAVFRPSTGQWFVDGSTPVSFGLNGDRPVPLPSAIYQAFFP